MTPETSKHRFFRWISTEIAPDHSSIVISSDEDFIQGVLSSRFHTLWMLGTGNRLGVGNDPRYNSTRTFQTFPFPKMTEGQRARIALAATELDHLRESYLNPIEWTKEETLVFPATVGGPWHKWIPGADSLALGLITEAFYVRRIPHPAMVKSVAARTMTRLYNEQPAWLRMAHQKLDEAVADAYGLPVDISESDLLAELLRRNFEQSALS